MNRALRWAGYGLAGVLGILVVAAAAVYGASEYRMKRTYDVATVTVSMAFQADEETIARGRHIATIRGCVDCHSENLSGRLFLEAPGVATLYSANLTSGRGGISSSYTTEDWVRAIRHGVSTEGKPLIFMPSHEFYPLSDEDMGALIAYLRSIPAVDHEVPRSSVGPIGRALFLAGQLPLLVPAELIDHTTPPPVAPTPGVTVAYGAYLSTAASGATATDTAEVAFRELRRTSPRPRTSPRTRRVSPGGRRRTSSARCARGSARTGPTSTRSCRGSSPRR
jgi:mono/diheme cytochrome c family protein